jgi:hypothetical protein
LREKKRFQIEKVKLPEDEPIQCETCMEKEKNFEFYQEGWFIEGEFYCSKHKDTALQLLEEIVKEGERMRLERERIIEERIKQSD